MPTVVAVQPTADIVGFVGAAAAFANALANYVPGSGNYEDIINNAEALGAAASALSENPLVKASGLPVALITSFTSLQNDLAALNASTSVAAQAANLLAVIGDGAGVLSSASAEIAIIAPETIPVTGELSAWSGIVSGIATSASVAVNAGVAVNNELQTTLNDINQDILGGFLDDFSFWNAITGSNNTGVIFIPSPGTESQSESVTVTGFTSPTGVAETLTDTIYGASGSSTAYSLLTAVSATGPTTDTISGTGANLTISNAAIDLQEFASAAINGNNNTLVLPDSSSVTVAGNNNTLTLGTADAAILTGTGQTVSVGSNDSVTLASGSSATFIGNGVNSLSLSIAGSDGALEAVPISMGSAAVTVTDNGSQTEAISLNANGQTLSDVVQGDPGSANPSYSSVIVNTYNPDGTLAETITSNSSGVTSDTTYTYGGGGYGGYGGYGGSGGAQETGSSTTSQDQYGVSSDTITTNGNTVTDDHLFTDPNGNTQETSTVTTTNPDGSQTVNTMTVANGAVTSTETATYNGNGGLVQDNVVNYQDGSVSSTSSVANAYSDAGQLQQSVATTVSGASTDTVTTSYLNYFPNTSVANEVVVTQEYTSPDGNFHSQSNSLFAQDGTLVLNNGSFAGDGSFAPIPSPPPPTGDQGSGSDLGGGGFAGSESDDGGGSYSGGGYSFVGGSNAPSGASNANIGIIAQHDLLNGSPIAGLIAQNASNQAYAAIAASQTSSASNNAVLEGAAWDSKVVTWSFGSGPGPTVAPFSNSIVSQYQATIEQAFAAWGAASGITFEEVSDSTSSDIRVGWGAFQTATSGVVGYTNYRNTEGAMNGAIVRLEDPTQDPLIVGPTGQLTYEGTDATLLQVAEHEIGHALGFADDSDPSSIMYAVASSANQTFDATDLAGIAQLYGGSSAPSQTALASTGSSQETYYNAANQLVISDTKNPDGSASDVSYSYNSDGSYVETAVATPAGSSTATTTVSDVNAQGQIADQQSTNADGSTDSQTWIWNSDGSYSTTDVHTPSGGGTSTTTTQDFNAQGQIVGQQSTNVDGSTDSQTWTRSSDGSYSTTDVHTPQDSGASTTTVDSYDQNNQLLSQNSYTPQSGGSYSDSWSKADGSQGTYWWNSSIGEYLDSWVNSNGSSFTDEYQYSSGGSPGASGASFTETYSGSDGSSGTRQYDAATNVTTINWVSSQTGTISGTSSGDAGFIGLSQDGELTNTQTDLSFFNPNVSPVFNTLLSEHH